MPTTMHNDQINTPSAVATWCFVVGAVLGVLGLISISTPWAAAATVDVFCGIMLVAGGVSQLAMTAATFSWRGFWLTLMCGVLSMMAGIGMLVLPNAGIEAARTLSRSCTSLRSLFETYCGLYNSTRLPVGLVTL